MQWLIDDHGVPWPGCSHPISGWDPAADPIRYAVNELGFIHLRRCSSGLAVSINPSRTRWPTIIAAFYAIAEEQPKRIALLWAGSELEIFGTVPGALHRIDELVEAHPPSAPVTSFKRRTFALLSEPSCNSLALLLRAWNESGARWVSERCAHPCAALPMSRILIISNPRDSDQLIYEHWGEAYDFLGPHWINIARGKMVEDQPFPKVAKQVAVRFRHTLADRQPYLEEVDLARSCNGATLIHRRYLRLILPWDGAGGDRILTVARTATLAS